MYARRYLGLAVSVLCAFSTWYYVERIVIPYQEAQAIELHTPRGNLSDLYPRWWGAHELLLHHRSPYSAEITREIQQGYYGRPLDPNNANDPKDQAAFAYPVYIVFLLAPTLWLPFNTVVRLGSAVLFLLLTILSVCWWASAVRFRGSRTSKAMIVILALGSFPVVQSLFLQQLTLLTAAMLAGACALVFQRRYGAVGILLAVATIKPQVALCTVAWLMIWSLGDLRRRGRLPLSFGLMLLVLLSASEWVLPGWFGAWRQAMRYYLVYTGSRSVLVLMLGGGAGFAASVAMGLLAALLGWRVRREEAGAPKFGLALSLAICTGLLALPAGSFYNEVLLLPVFMFLIDNWPAARQRGPAARFAYFLAGFVLCWGWLASLALALIAPFSRPAAFAGHNAPLFGIPVLPVAILCPLALFVVDVFRKNKTGRLLDEAAPGASRTPVQAATP